VQHPGRWSSPEKTKTRVAGTRGWEIEQRTLRVGGAGKVADGGPTAREPGEGSPLSIQSGTREPKGLTGGKRGAPTRKGKGSSRTEGGKGALVQTKTKGGY